MTTVVFSCATWPTDSPNAPEPPRPPATICSRAPSSSATDRTRSATVVRAGPSITVDTGYSSIIESLDHRDYSTCRYDAGVSAPGRARLIELLQAYADEAGRLG